MKPQDLAILKLVGVSLVAAVVAFVYRRRRGSSRAVATTVATYAFGGAVALGFFLFAPAIYPRPSGMGLERFVLPPVLALIFLVIGAALGLVVYVFENRTPPPPSWSLAPSGRERTPLPPDWRAAAREIAKL